MKLGHAGKILLGIVAVGGVVTAAAAMPGLAVALQPFMKKKRYSQKQYIDRTVESLISHKLLAYTTDKEGNAALKLTRKGQWEAGIRRLDSRNKDKKAKWDSVWRVIVFDVPEHKRSIRAELRRAVELYGFVQLQKSVWVYPYPCDDFIVLIKQHLGIANDVLYMQVSFLENDKWLKKEFSL